MCVVTGPVVMSHSSLSGADWSASGLDKFRDLRSEVIPTGASKDTCMWIKERRCPVPVTAGVAMSKVTSLADAIGGCVLLIGSRPKGGGNLGTTWTAEVVVSDAQGRIAFRAIRGSALACGNARTYGYCAASSAP